MSKLKASAAALAAMLSIGGAVHAQDANTTPAENAGVAVEAIAEPQVEPAQTTQNEVYQVGQRQIDIQTIGQFLQRNPGVLEQVVNLMDFEIQPNQVELDAEFIAANTIDIFSDSLAPVYGNPDGEVVLTVFTDFSCPHCINFNAELDKFLADEPRAKVIVRELPVISEGSAEAARFALAVNKIGGAAAYKKVNEALFAAKGAYTVELYDGLLAELGLDKEKIIPEMGAAQINDHLGRNIGIARALRISGTPSFIVGNMVVRGGVPAETIKQAVTTVYDTPAQDAAAQTTETAPLEDAQAEVKAD